MRITESQLRRIIRQEVRALREGASGTIRMGGLTASIPGDSRYTDRLEVLYNPADDTVTVAVGESAAAGGMDTLGGGSMGFGGDSQTVPAEPRAVMAAINGMIGRSKFLFKRYGKPTRNFRWETDEVGLSAARVSAALDWARRVAAAPPWSRGAGLREGAGDDWSEPELTAQEIQFIQDPANERSLKTHLINQGIDIEGTPGRIHNNIYSLSDFEGDGRDAVTLRQALRDVIQTDRTAKNPYSILNKRSR